jgi:hypothetical protein
MGDKYVRQVWIKSSQALMGYELQVHNPSYAKNPHPHALSHEFHERFTYPHWSHSNAWRGISALFARQKSST